MKMRTAACGALSRFLKVAKIARPSENAEE